MIPKYMKPLVGAVLRYADQHGDGHAGWAAICDHWERYDIACTLARDKVRDPAAAIQIMGRVADEIVANTAAMRASR